jgi:hypothetical protein
MQSSITHQACHSDFGGIYELNPFLIAIVTTKRSDEIFVFILAYCFTQPTGLPRLLTAEESSPFGLNQKYQKFKAVNASSDKYVNCFEPQAEPFD